MPVAQSGVHEFSQTLPTPVAPEDVQLVQVAFWTPMPLSAHATVMDVGSTWLCCPWGPGAVQSAMTPGRPGVDTVELGDVAPGAVDVVDVALIGAVDVEADVARVVVDERRPAWPVPLPQAANVATAARARSAFAGRDP